jgi:mono/diheme cytochrome c family protein
MRASRSSAARAEPSGEEALAGEESEAADEEDAGSEPAPEEADAVGLPCEVKAVFSAHCHACHGLDAKNGTPLLTRDDLLATSKKDPAMTVVERALLRAAASEKPMPPMGKGEPLNEQQLSVIRDWVEQGSEAGRCDE